MIEQLPPYDLDSEAAYLASVYRASCAGDSVTVAKLLGLVSKSDFHLEDNGTLYEIFHAKLSRGRVLDERTLLDAIGNDQMAEQSLIEAAKQTLSSGYDYCHGEDYAAIVKRLSVQRQAIRQASALEAAMYGRFGDDSDPQAVIQNAISRLWDIVREGGNHQFSSLKDMLAEAVSIKRECPTGNVIQTGCPTIDAWQLFASGATTIVAARPSMGKSTLIRWLLSLFASQGVKCGLGAVEERKSKIATNYLSAYSGIENRRVRGESLDKNEWDAISAAKETAGNLPIIVCDDCMTAEDVLSGIEIMATQYGCQVVAVDHIQKLYLGKRTENRNQEITRISADISSMFKRLGVCGIMASQLSRPAQKTGLPPPPNMSDLRESGSIEQDGDTIILLHREDYYLKGKSGRTPNHQCKIIVDKNRDGRTGHFTLREELQFQRFREQTENEKMLAVVGGHEEPVPEFE